MKKTQFLLFILLNSIIAMINFHIPINLLRNRVAVLSLMVSPIGPHLFVVLKVEIDMSDLLWRNIL